MKWSKQLVGLGCFYIFTHFGRDVGLDLVFHSHSNLQVVVLRVKWFQGVRASDLLPHAQNSPPGNSVGVFT